MRGYRRKVRRGRGVSLGKIKALSAALLCAALLFYMSAGVIRTAARRVDTRWLEMLFCSALPLAHARIQPEPPMQVTLSEVLFGFDPKDPMSIIKSQILVVKAANDAYSTPEPLSPPETDDTDPNAAPQPSPAPARTMPPDGKPIEERTVNPTDPKGYLSAEGLYVRNHTTYTPDIPALLNEPLKYKIEKGKPQVLIFHTHTSEAFTPDGKDYYEPSDPDRTEDSNFNVVRVGKEIAGILNGMGIETIHDATLHDYPSYNGSYRSSLATVEKRLAEHPSIKVVLDIHRDAAATAEGAKLKFVTTIDGVKTAQVMIVCGTNNSGLEHPNWRENFKLALRLQAKMTQLYPSLARPVYLVKERYNMHTSNGALLLEVGSNGNTLEEAVQGGKRLADALGKMLLEQR